MKRFFGVLLLIITIGFVQSGCKDNPLLEDNTSGEIEATIDGSNWKGIGGTAVRNTTNVGGNSVTTLTIVATKIIDEEADINETMELTIYTAESGQVAVGTYNIDTDGMPKAQFSFSTYDGDQQVTFFSTVGTVTLSEITASNAKGSFSGTVENSAGESKEISNGTFDVATFNY